MSHRIEKKLPLERRVYTADVPADHSIDRVLKADIYEYSLEIGVLTEVD